VVDLEVAPDGSWFALYGSRCVCSSVPARRILVALVRQADVHRGAPVAAGELVEAAWPGEKIAFYAAKNRLHVAIAALRKAGLKRVLLTDEGGYTFARQLRVAFADRDEGDTP
jgi:hypothetical protein